MCRDGYLRGTLLARNAWPRRNRSCRVHRIRCIAGGALNDKLGASQGRRPAEVGLTDRTTEPSESDGNTGSGSSRQGGDGRCHTREGLQSG